jgi:hypothetical protein
MKKTIFVLFLFMILPSTVLAWDDCVYGKVNDPYPGDCARYIDTDDDGICDHSQPAPEDRDEVKQVSNTEVEPGEEKEKKIDGIYHLIPISALLFVLYIISHILSKKKVISIVNHRKIWNLLLLISFIISGLLGILLIIKINFGLAMTLPFNMLFWHVEIGIVMFLITIFHLSWHLPYFKNIFKLK